MENNELVPSKSTTGLLSKIKNMFKSLFGRKSNMIDEVSVDIEQNNNSEQSFMNDLKDKTDIECKKETLEHIIDEVEKDSQKLDNLTIEQLEEVNEYYDNEIEKVDKKINKLKNSAN